MVTGPLKAFHVTPRNSGQRLRVLDYFHLRTTNYWFYYSNLNVKENRACTSNQLLREAKDDKIKCTARTYVEKLSLVLLSRHLCTPDSESPPIKANNC